MQSHSCTDFVFQRIETDDEVWLEDTGCAPAAADSAIRAEY